MLCEKCGKNNATVMYTQIVNGKKSKLGLCQACASGESIFDNLGSLLGFGAREAASPAVCKGCGMTVSELSRTGRMGCGECYRTFRGQAEAMLKKIHGSSQHIEKTPMVKTEAPRKEEKDELTILREALKQAILEENFEEAAILRDKIREKEGA